jgi:hypothetical protein
MFMILPRYQTHVYRKAGLLALINYAVIHPRSCRQWIPTIDTILTRKGWTVTPYGGVSRFIPREGVSHGS